MKYLQNRFCTQVALLLLTMVTSMGAVQLVADSPDLPVIGIDASGNKIAVWQVDADDGSHNIQASSFQPGIDTVWTTPVMISTSGVDSFSPSIVMNASGQAIATWIAVDTVNEVYTLTAAMGSVGSSWTSPLILSNSSHDVFALVPTQLNADGDAVVIWNSYDTVSTATEVWTRAAVFNTSNTWDTALKVQ